MLKIQDWVAFQPNSAISFLAILSSKIAFIVTGSSMNKMSDVLEHSLVQKFVHSLSAQTEHLDELIDGILNAPQQDFHQAISSFVADQDTPNFAQALDIQKENLQAIQDGLALQKEHLADTAKIVALCLALETNILTQLEVAESLKDFPM